MALAALLAFQLSLAEAHAEDVVYFGGAAFTGSVSEASENIPFTNAAMGESGLLAINQRLLQELAQHPPARFRVEFADLATLDGHGSSTAMAVAIDRETITVEQVGNQYKLLFELAAQALFFDFRERMVRFAFPVTIQRIEVLDAPPDDTQLSALARDMLLGSSPASLAPAVAAALEDIQLPGATSRRLQVVEVRSSEKVEADNARIARLSAAGMVGHEFSKILSGTLQLGLLPYQSGHAIGGAMAARFADGRVYNLAIPEPDYEIRLELQDFRSGTLKETPAFRQDLMGAFFAVRVVEPMSGRNYMDHSLRFGAVKTVPASQVSYDRESAYYEALLGGLATFAQSITGKGAETWLKEQPEARELRESIKHVRELIEKCR